MAERDRKAADPLETGSPFKTGNFSKFFFGIVIAALVLGALIVGYFLLMQRRHVLSTQPQSEIRTMAESGRAQG